MSRGELFCFSLFSLSSPSPSWKETGHPPPLLYPTGVLPLPFDPPGFSLAPLCPSLRLWLDKVRVLLYCVQCNE